MRARQQKTPEARRADILRASEKLFLEKGMTATRIEDIAKDADIGKGTLYLYFKNKDDILVGLGQLFLHYFIERIEYHLTFCKSDNIEEQLAGWLNGCLDAFYDKAQLHHLVFHQSKHHPVEHKHANPAVKLLEEILNSHEFSDSAFLASIIFNIVHGGMDFAFSQKPIINRDALFEKMLPMMTSLVKLN